MLAVPIAVSEVAPTGNDIFDLFDDRPHAHEKRSLESDNPAVRKKRPRTDDEAFVLEDHILGDLV